jgi:hypothetical protein
LGPAELILIPLDRIRVFIRFGGPPGHGNPITVGAPG